MAVKTLPYITKPSDDQFYKLGDASTGIIKLPRYDDITPNEKQFVDDRLKDLPSTNKALITLVERITEKTGKPSETIWQMVQQNQTVELMMADMEGFSNLQKIQEDVGIIRRLVMAAAILIYRVPECKDWTLEDVGNPNLVKPKMLRLLEEFYLNEQSNWKNVDEPDTLPEEQIKKISPVEESK